MDDGINVSGWMGKQRGHWIIHTDIGWLYGDPETHTLYESADNQRPCVRCGEPPTVGGHDACIADLPGVSAACCGHGDPKFAYVQFSDDQETIRREDALAYFVKVRGQDLAA